MSLSMVFRILTTSLFTYPEIKGCKNSKNSTHTQYIVKVPNNIICIVQSYINPSVCQYNSCKTSNSEQYQESQSKQHRSCKPKRSSVHSPKPTKNFNSSRYSNNHGSTCKVPTSIYIQTNGIHVMSPNQEALYSNCPHSINHSNITKYRFTCKETLYMTNNTKGRQNQYIYFRVTEKPELMLVLNNVTSSSRLEKACIEISVSLQHCQSCSKYRKATNQQNTYKNQSPYKKRYSIQGHSLSSHVCNCNQEVNRSLNTSNSNNVQTKNCQVNRSSRVTQNTTKRRICSPPHTRSLLNQSTQQQQEYSHGQNPKADVIHSRKCHIRPSNHNRYQPVTKSTHQSRHNHIEQHQQPVCSNLYIIKLSISCQNSRTCTPLLHSNQQTHSSSNNTRPPCKYKVHHSNVFSICTTKPSNKLFIIFVRCIFHFFFYSISFIKKKT
eukprot:GHUV01001225.1.p1 GENE.GHUV01001225.1~~GHUV01001225.1.p1  ORF type:complete len:437 (-),score=-62.77 GHUV01001225.1:24-1334(-)